METIRLGRTDLIVTRSGFGALPIQRVAMDDAARLLRAAYEGGITFYDTARAYTDSEAKIGAALGDVREKIVIATKTHGASAEKLAEDLDTSLCELRTDYIDLYQFHIAKKCHRPGEPDGLYDAMLRARDAGRVRHIGLTAHRLDVALEAAASGLYDTVQFPLNYLSSEKELALVALCAAHDVGFIAMKALSGGLVTDASLAFAFLRQYPNVVPIWGIQKQSELEEFLRFEKTPPLLDAARRERIERDKAELGGDFCRGCGYCLPCPAEIELNWVMRMPEVLRRMNPAEFVTEEWQKKMERAKDCIQCGTCKTRCPYELDPPTRIIESYENYRAFLREWSTR